MPQAIAPAIGAAIGGFWAGTTGVALIQLGLGLALSQLAQALRPKPKTASAGAGGIRTEVTLEGGTLPQTIIFGRYATAGTYVAPPYAKGRIGGEQDIPNAFRWQIVDLADFPITEVLVIWVDGTKFTIGTDLLLNGHVYAPSGVTRPEWTEDPDTLAINWKLGTQTVVDAVLLEEHAGHAERPWTSAMVGTGVAYLWAMHRYDPDVYQGEPRLKVEVHGAKLYDPRKDDTAGGTGTHRYGNQATWAFTENPITMIAAIMRGIPLADGRIWGLGVAPSDLPFGVWSASANHCDGTVDGAPRYRAGFEARMATAEQGGDEPFDVIDELLKACAGSIADCGGSWQVRAGPPGLPVSFLTDEDIVVSRPQDFEPHRGVTDVYNAVRATHPKPGQNWASSEAPLRVDAAAEAEDGERLVANLQLPAVWHGPQVQRLGLLYLRDARRMRRHTITLPPEYSGLLPLDVISWSSARNGYVDKLFEVFEVAIEPTTLAVTLAIREIDPSDYDWDPADLLPAVEPSPTKVVVVKVPLPGFAVEAVILTDVNGDSRRPAIRMSWPPTLSGVQSITWEIRIAATGAPAPGGSTSNIDAGQAIASSGLLPNMAYELRAKGDRTVWTSWLPVTTPNVRLGASDLAQTIIDQINAATADANQAAQDASTALTEAESASTSAENAAKVAIGGDTALASPYFETTAHWPASGTVAPTYAANDHYARGQTGQFAIPATTDTGNVETRSNIAGAFNGTVDTTHWKVELDFTLVSGGLGGAGIAVQWVATDATVHEALLPATSGVTMGGGRYTLAGVLARPGSFAGKTLSHMVVQVHAAHASKFGTNAIKTIKFHRVLARMATAEETGGGAVGAAISQVYLATANLDSALATLQSNAGTTFGDLRADANFSLTALAGIDGSVARLSGLVTVNGSTTATGIEAVAFDNAGNAAGSALLLHGDNVFVPGTLTTNALIVGMGTNLLPHTSFREGTRGWAKGGSGGNVETQTSLLVRQPGQTWAGKTYPTLALYQSGTGTTGYAQAMSVGVKADGTTEVETFPVTVGEWIDASAKVSTHRCTGTLLIQWLDANGVATGTSPSSAIPELASDSANPKLWPTYWVKGQAPAGAVSARVLIRKNGTLSGADSWLFVYRPMAAETHANAAYPTPYSPEATTFIDGGRLITRSVEAQHLKALTITAASGVLDYFSVQHFNLKGYAVAFKAALAWRGDPSLVSTSAVEYYAGGYRLKDGSKTAPVTIQNIRFARTAGYRTRFSGSMSISGWGTDATIHLIFERLAPGGSWVRFGNVWDNAGYRGRAASISFIVEDTTTNAANSQGLTKTRYRIRACKYNGPTQGNWDVHLGSLFLDVEHYKQA